MTDWGRVEMLGPILFAATLTLVSIIWQRLWFLSLIAAVILLAIVSIHAD